LKIFRTQGGYDKIKFRSIFQVVKCSKNKPENQQEEARNSILSAPKCCEDCFLLILKLGWNVSRKENRVHAYPRGESEIKFKESAFHRALTKVGGGDDFHPPWLTLPAAGRLHSPPPCLCFSRRSSASKILGFWNKVI